MPFYGKKNSFEVDCLLLDSELTEVFEGIRTLHKDKHLPEYDNWVVEFADFCIRVFNKVGPLIKKHNIKMFDDKIFDEMFNTKEFDGQFILVHLLQMKKFLLTFYNDDENERLLFLALYAMHIIKEHGIDPYDLILKKSKVNTSRNDLNDNFGKPGGKKF